MTKLKMETFGKDSFKISLPSCTNATLELFQAIYDATEVDISLEDDGYIIVYTDSESEAEKIKEMAETFLDKAESGYGDVKGLEPADKDFQRIEDLRTKAAGDEIKMYKLAQNMANTFKNSNSYEKCIRRAKAADVLELGGVAEIFYKKAEEIKPQDVAANHVQTASNMVELVGGEKIKAKRELRGKSNNWNMPGDVTIPKGTVLEVPSRGTNYGDVFAKILQGECKVKSMKGEYTLSAGDVVGLKEGHSSRYPYDIGTISESEWKVLSKVATSGETAKADGKRTGKLSYRKEGFGDSASWFMIYGRSLFQLKDQESAKELKKLGSTFKFHINDMDEAIDLEPVATATNFLENKYSNEEEEFTIDEFEKDAGPVPVLKKYKNSFYSIVHYNKETDQFEIMIYAKEADFKKNNPKVLVLDSNLNTTVADSTEEDMKSQNLEWGFYGSLKSAPFGLSDKDAMIMFMKTVELISNSTGYMENVIRDFLDSQAGRFLADMVSFKSLEAGNLQSAFDAVKSTIGEGALTKLRFEKFVSSHDPADFGGYVSDASVASNYDTLIVELEKAQARDPEVSEKFGLHWHKLEKVADFFAEVYNGGLNQFLDHYGNNIPRSVLVDVGGKACNEIVDIIRDGSDSIKDYLDQMESEYITDEDFHNVISPMYDLTDKIYENDKIEQACGEILEFYGVKK